MRMKVFQVSIAVSLERKEVAENLVSLSTTCITAALSKYIRSRQTVLLKTTSPSGSAARNRCGACESRWQRSYAALMRFKSVKT